MRLHHSSIIIKLTAIIFLLLCNPFGFVPQVFSASSRLPNITPEMERPEFWIKKVQNPRSPLLTPDKIHKMNEENLKRQNLRLCRIKDLKEGWTREEILSLQR